MDLRRQLIEYREKLADAACYPETPAWCKEMVLERLDAMLTATTTPELPEAFRNFRRGAAYFLYDNLSAADCEDLLNDMPRPGDLPTD